jgi:hypothetical protein
VRVEKREGRVRGNGDEEEVWKEVNLRSGPEAEELPAGGARDIEYGTTQEIGRRRQTVVV